jgi:hypothetical protein
VTSVVDPGAVVNRLARIGGLLHSHGEVLAGPSRRSYSITAGRRGVMQQSIVELRELANEVLGGVNA